MPGKRRALLFVAAGIVLLSVCSISTSGGSERRVSLEEKDSVGALQSTLESDGEQHLRALRGQNGTCDMR